MKKKTDFRNILVYLCMILLVLVIVLPPVCRLVFKDTGTTGDDSTTTTAAALICQRQVVYTDVTYNITATTNYVNDDANQLSVRYAKTLANAASTIATNDIETEIATWQSVPGITSEVNGDVTRFVVSREFYDTNATTYPFLDNYFNDIDQEQDYYTNLGYQCQVIES